MKLPEPKIVMIIGDRSRGKTGTFIRQILVDYIAHRQGEYKAMVVDLEKNYNYDKPFTPSDYSPARQKLLSTHVHFPVKIIPTKRMTTLERGTVRVLPIKQHAGDFVDEIIHELCYDQSLRDCLVCIEDAARFMPDNNGLDSTLRNLIINAKQRSMDIVLIFHFWTDVPPRLIKWINRVYLHKCSEGVNVRKKFFGQAKSERLEAAEQRIARHPNKYHFEIVDLD